MMTSLATTAATQQSPKHGALAEYLFILIRDDIGVALIFF